MVKDEVELSRYFHRNCQAFARLKLTYLGRHTFGAPDEVAGLSIIRFNKFVVGSKRSIDIKMASVPNLRVLGITWVQHSQLSR